MHGGLSAMDIVLNLLNKFGKVGVFLVVPFWWRKQSLYKK